ncbi:MAG: glycosyltransferase family 4 protein [Nostoc sp.]|uniref:glycosyltransferase family 4 protein n=1 Tax=Nostoc sp. TaxID=1180 RepID=UPI002FF90C32
MKIVFVNPVGVIGGAERVLLTMLTALNTQSNIQLHLIVGTDGALVEEAKKLGVEVTLLKLPEEFNQLGDSAFKSHNKTIAIFILLLRIVTILTSIWKYLREFRRSLRELKPDLIHSNGIKTHILTTLVGVKGVPIVWHIHDFYGSRPLIAQVLKWLSDRATLGIAISQAVAQDARTTLPHLPIKVIYNAIDVNYFSPAPESSHIPLRVGLVATFARWKGHDIFLESVANIVRSHPDLNVRFYIVGGAIYQTRGSQFSEQELKNQASNLGIADQVDFLGFQQNIAEIYRWLDIVVHASTQPEPFGLAIIEAMACGKPVIVSQAGGATELFTHNYDAVGVTPGEPTALAAAILDLLNNTEKRQIISNNARLTVIKRFSHERLYRQILAVYT